jgi:hypothetical protein
VISAASDPFDINKSRYDDMSCFSKVQGVFCRFYLPLGQAQIEFGANFMLAWPFATPAM